ncbi:MAG: biotin--[acetyl-CoA-carboxylase] ligase, partial [Bacteroidia bacterium]
MSLPTIGKYIIRLETVDSTNNYAAALISKSKPAEGTAIMADFQDYGRGQRETIWESENGKNLLVSFILYPQIDTADYFLLNECFSLAVREVIEDITGLDVKIKWPNDILVNNKKIAGILIENSIRGNTILYSIA